MRLNVGFRSDLVQDPRANWNCIFIIFSLSKKTPILPIAPISWQIINNKARNRLKWPATIDPNANAGFKYPPLTGPAKWTPTKTAKPKAKLICTISTIFLLMISLSWTAGLKTLPHPKKTMINVPNISAKHSTSTWGQSCFVVGSPKNNCKSHLVMLKVEEILARNFQRQWGIFA